MSSSKTSKISKKTHKIIFLGDSGVGKTCIIDRFANNKYDEYFNVSFTRCSRPLGLTLSARISSIRVIVAGCSCGILLDKKSSSL